MRSVTRHTLAAVVLAVLLAGCDSGTDSPTTPTDPTPTPAQVTEVLTGELTKGATKVHPISVGTGVVRATLSSLSPVATTLIGTGIGLWDGTTCTAVTPTAVETSSMQVGATLTGTAMSPVSLCVKVYDVGNIPDGTTYAYAMTVTHY